MSAVIEKAKQIEGWMNDKELEWLAERANECNTIVEFGCYKGRSTRALGDNTKGIVYAVDPWDGTYYNNDSSISGIKTNVYNEFERNLKDLIEMEKVIPLKMKSTYFPSEIKADLVFIDADHRFLEVKNDIEIALKILKPLGIISGHDYIHITWPGVRQAVNYVFKDTIHLVDSIWWRQI